MPTVTYASGPVRRVKNLGWLRAHAGEVVNLRVQALGDNGAELTAHLHAERVCRVYVVHFASLVVLRGVLARWRSLAGVPIAWR